MPYCCSLIGSAILLRDKTTHSTSIRQSLVLTHAGCFWRSEISGYGIPNGCYMPLTASALDKAHTIWSRRMKVVIKLQYEAVKCF